MWEVELGAIKNNSSVVLKLNIFIWWDNVINNKKIYDLHLNKIFFTNFFFNYTKFMTFFHFLKL